MANNLQFDLLLKDERFIAAMKNAEKATKRLNNTIKRVEKTADKAFSTRSVGKFSVALIGVQTAALAARKSIQLISTAVGASVKNFAQFEKSMLAVRTLLDETSFATLTVEEGFTRMGQEMTRVLQTIPVDSQQAAKALFDITSAQISAADATTVLTAAGKLAVAGNTRVDVTTQAVVRSIVAFGLEAENATNIAAKFFTAQKLGLTTVEELSTGIGLVAAQAAQMGLTLDEVLSSVVGTTRGALGTRRAFVGLSAAFKNIIKPGKEARELAESYGITLGETGVTAAGGFIPFLNDLNEKIKGSSEALTTIFPAARAFKQVSSLLTASGVKGAADSLRELGDNAKNSETLIDNYAIAVGGLSNQWDIFTNNVQVATRIVVEKLAPGLTSILNLGTDAAKVVADVLGADATDEQRLDQLIKKNNELSQARANAFKSGDNSALLKANEELREIEFEIGAIQDRQLRLAKEISAEAVEIVQLSHTQFNNERATFLVRKQAAESAIKSQKQLEAQQKITEENNLKGFEKASEAFDAQSSKYLKDFNKRQEATQKWSQGLIDAVKAVDETETETSTRQFNETISRIQKSVKDSLITKELGLDAEIAAHTAHFEELSKIEDKHRAENAKAEAKALADMEKRRAESLDRLKASLTLFNESLAAVPSGAAAQANIATTREAATRADQDLQALELPDTISLDTSTLEVASSQTDLARLEKALAAISSTISDSDKDILKVSEKINDEQNKDRKDSLKRLRESVKLQRSALKLNKDSIQADLKAAKIKLGTDEKANKTIISENKKRNEALESGLEQVEQSNKAATAAIEERDRQGRAVLTGAANSFIPGLGGIIEGLTANPEDASLFINSIVDQVPVIITALANNAPAIIDALIESTPAIIDAIVSATPQIITALVGAIPQVAVTLLESVVKLLGEGVKTVLFDPLFQFVDGIERILIRLGILDEKRTDKDTVTATDAGRLAVDLEADQESLVKKLAEEGIIIGGTIEATNLPKATATEDLVLVTRDPQDEQLSRAFLATGGIVTGSGTRDTVPAVLTPGELVIDRTTGPRLNRFLNSAEGRGAEESGNGENRELLARILSEVLKPVKVNSQVEFNGDILADIMLDLSRREARTT